MTQDDKDKKNWFLRHKVLTVVIVIVGLAIIGSAFGPPATEISNSSSSNQTNSQQAEQPKATPKPAKKSSQQIYDETQVGQTKEEVIANAGHGPDNCVDSEIQGLGQSSTCSWGTLTITFIDGKVSSKTKL